MAAASPAIVAFTRHAEQRALDRRLDLSDTPSCCSAVTINGGETTDRPTGCFGRAG